MKNFGRLFSCGSNYAKYRPSYPPELFRTIYEYGAIPKGAPLAVDVGCGTGQSVKDLAQHFEKVIGVDPSKSMLDSAFKAENVQYVVGDAESLPFIANNSVDLVTAAQAAHWFDLERFNKEVARILKPKGVVAIWTYGLPILPKQEANDILNHFHFETLKGYWEPNRELVTSGYAHIASLPFNRFERRTVPLVMSMTVNDFISYVDTWSGLKTHREKHPERDALESFGNALVGVWDDANTAIQVHYPITLLLAQK